MTEENQTEEVEQEEAGQDNLPAPVTRMDALRQTIGIWVDMMPGVLPYNQTKDRIIDVFTLAAQEIPKLKKCAETDKGKMSIVRAVLGAARYGLEIGGQLGHAWVIPFLDKKTSKYYAQLILGYLGLVSLAYRNPKVISIEAEVVREPDEFEWSLGTSKYINHKPAGDPEAQATHAYCIITTAGGGQIMKVMSVKEIESFRARAKAKSDGPWVTDWAAMAMKTVFKQTAKWAPKTDDLAKALQYDNLAERADQGLVKDAEIVSVTTHPNDPDNGEPPTKSDELAGTSEEKEPASSDGPVSEEVIALVGKIQQEISGRKISEELFFKWMAELKMDANMDLHLHKSAKLEALLKKCREFG